MRNVLVDGNGNVFDEDMEGFKRSIGATWPARDHELIAFACRNMGAVHLSFAPRGVRVTANPELTGPKARGAVAPLVGDSRGWTMDARKRTPAAAVVKLFVGAAGLLYWLGTSTPPEAPKGRLYLEEPLDVSEGSLGFNLDAAKGGFGSPGFCEFELLARGWRVSTWVEGADSAGLFLEHLGPGFPAVWTTWLERGRGVALHHGADSQYMRFVEKRYYEVLGEGRLSTNMVSAEVSFPGEALEKVQYERMLLPLAPGFGERRIVVLTR
jgi:hypothetical protein